MPIFLLDSSFGEVQDRSKAHLDRMSRTCILNLFHMCKVGLIYPTCIRDVSHTPIDDYILERLGVHFTHTILWRHFYSFLDGDGAAFLVLHLGLWCSFLLEYS